MTTTARQSSSTVTETDTNDEQPQALLLRLQRSRPQRGVKWREDTVDNEGMDKKKSKCCCVYRKPHKFGESSSSSSSSSDSDSDSDQRKNKPKSSHRCTEHCRGHGKSDYRRKKEKLPNPEVEATGVGNQGLEPVPPENDLKKLDGEGATNRSGSPSKQPSPSNQHDAA